MTDKVGYEEGEVCNRGGCGGIIAESKEGDCSCHINPPCSACVNTHYYCPECGWDEEATE